MEAATASADHRHRLIAALQARGALADERVEAAIRAIPRERFLPGLDLDAVYRDEAIVTKRSPAGLPLSSSSQPSLMAQMLELLDVRAGDRVLEVGAGTGYNAALLAQLAGPDGAVTSVDIDPAIADEAQRALDATGARVMVVAGDGRAGRLEGGPFDRIIVTAAADAVAPAWRDQLREGGRIVLPLRLDPSGGALQIIPALERRGRTLRSVALTWGGFMPLHGGDGGAPGPTANLSAVLSQSGRHTSLATLSGDGIGQLSEGAAQRALAELLDGTREPRRRGLTPLGGMRPPWLLLYLHLSIAPRRRVILHRSGRWGIGVVDRSGHGLALLSLRSPWATSTAGQARWRLDAYANGSAAADELEATLDDWRDGELELTVDAGLRPRYRWPGGG